MIVSVYIPIFYILKQLNYKGNNFMDLFDSDEEDQETYDFYESKAAISSNPISSPQYNHLRTALRINP